MHITFEGTAKNIDNAELEYAANFYMGVLAPRLVDKLSVNIVLKKLGDVHGFCEVVDGERRPRDFEIELNRKLNRYDILHALAHELVHVKQYARNEILDKGKVTHFLGKTYVNESTDYYDSPWEIEAYGREVGLYIKFIKHVKNMTLTKDKMTELWSDT